jgi:hypothetical protein
MICIHAANLRFLLRHGGKRFPYWWRWCWRCTSRCWPYVSTTWRRRQERPDGAFALPDRCIGAYVLTVLMLSIGAVLMATDRLTTELNHRPRTTP